MLRVLKERSHININEREEKKAEQSKQRITIVMRRQHHIFNNSYSQLV